MRKADLKAVFDTDDHKNGICQVKPRYESKVFVQGFERQLGGLYEATICPEKTQSPLSLLSSNDWHARMGHVFAKDDGENNPNGRGRSTSASAETLTLQTVQDGEVNSRTSTLIFESITDSNPRTTARGPCATNVDAFTSWMPVPHACLRRLYHLFHCQITKD